MKIIKLVIPVIALICISCQRNQSKTKEISSESTNLARDFTKAIQHGDTIIIDANLSVCTLFWKEKNLFYKQGDSVYLTTIYQLDNFQWDTLEKVYYPYMKSGHCFEHYFRTLRHKQGSCEDNPGFIQIKNDENTINFYPPYPHGITRKIIVTEAYKAIKFKLYGHLDLYKPSVFRL